MYQWPKELKPVEFRGLIVEAITFTVNTISISFGKDYRLTVESSIRLKIMDKEEHIPIPPSSNTNLFLVLGRSVQDSSLDVDLASLILKFNEGIEMRLEGGDKEYECFHVKVKGNEFVV